jgi:hypothetical protein
MIACEKGHLNIVEILMKAEKSIIHFQNKVRQILSSVLYDG